MFTIRNMGGVALFLFGTTFLWLTPSFASSGVSTTGAMWTVTAVLALATLVGFTPSRGKESGRGGPLVACEGPARRVL